MPQDLSFLSNDELNALAKGDYSKLSDTSLNALSQGSSSQSMADELAGGAPNLTDQLTGFSKVQVPPEAAQRQTRLEQMSAYRDSLDPSSKEVAKITTEIEKETKALAKAYPQIEQSKKQIDASSDMRAALGKLDIFGNEFKRMQDSGSIPTSILPPGPLRGPLNWIEGKIQTNPVEPSFNGGKTEMAASLAKVITGGSRPPGNIAQGIIDSLPGDSSSYETFANKMALNLQNALQQRAADENLVYDPEVGKKVILEALKKFLPEKDSANFSKSFLGSKLKNGSSQSGQATHRFNPQTGRVEPL